MFSKSFARELDLAAAPSLSRSRKLKLMSKTRIPPQPAELDAMLEHHLGFEFNRFLLGWEIWNSRQFQQPALDLLRESCLIPFRLVMVFFFPRTDPKKATKFRDIFVSDYFTEDKKLWPPTLRVLLEPTPEWVSEYRLKADRQLAHITLERIDIERRGEKPWGNRPLSDMAKIVHVFINSLPPDRRRHYERCKWRKAMEITD